VQLTGLLQRHNPPFRSAQDRPRDVEARRRDAATGNYERVRQGHPPLEVRDLGFHAGGEFRRHHHEVVLQLRVFARIRRQFGANGEELALDSKNDRMARAVTHLRPCQPKR
jgi:hypothetical protein